MMTNYEKITFTKWGKVLKKSPNINVLPWSFSDQKVPKEQTFITKYWASSLDRTVYKHETSMITRWVDKLSDSKQIFFSIQRVWVQILVSYFQSSSYLSRMGLGLYLWKTFESLTWIENSRFDHFSFIKSFITISNSFKRAAASSLMNDDHSI